MDTLGPEGHPALGSFQTAVCPGDGEEGNFLSPVGRTGTSAAKMKALGNKPKPSSPAYKDTSQADLPTVKNKTKTKNEQISKQNGSYNHGVWERWLYSGVRWGFFSVGVIL